MRLPFRHSNCPHCRGIPRVLARAPRGNPFGTDRHPPHEQRPGQSLRRPLPHVVHDGSRGLLAVDRHDILAGVAALGHQPFRLPRDQSLVAPCQCRVGLGRAPEAVHSRRGNRRCLFALHPVNVESVAWVVQRKNVCRRFSFCCRPSGSDSRRGLVWPRRPLVLAESRGVRPRDAQQRVGCGASRGPAARRMVAARRTSLRATSCSRCPSLRLPWVHRPERVAADAQRR